MDMTKAFDHVSHKLLLNKLYKYGVRGNILQLIESYLNERTQITEINQLCCSSKTETKYLSNPRTVTYGVPQGSVLGPLLFLIYINDLPKAIKFPMVLFADDSTVVFKLSDAVTFENDINKTLVDIINWLTCNNLIMNLDKTKIVSYSQKKSTLTLNINYGMKRIEEDDTIKFLGIWIDKNMTWKTQTDAICKKLNNFAYALYRLSKIVHQTAVLAAYHAYVTSTLRYGLIFWGNATDRELVFRAQKKCVRAVCGIAVTDSCVPYFKELKILTMPALYIYEVATFVKTNINMFGSLKSRRHADKISNMPSKTALLSKSFFGMSSRIYNKIPKKIREIDNIAVFKKSLHIFLITRPYYTVNEFLSDRFVTTENL